MKTAQPITSHIADPSGSTVYEFHSRVAHMVNSNPTRSQEIHLRYFLVLRRCQPCEGTTLRPKGHSRCLQITFRKMVCACINNDQVSQEFFLVFCGPSTPRRIFLGSLDPWECRRYAPSKRLEPTIKPQCVTSQKTSKFTELRDSENT
jgi:hypothetical protein